MPPGTVARARRCARFTGFREWRCMDRDESTRTKGSSESITGTRENEESGYECMGYRFGRGRSSVYIGAVKMILQGNCLELMQDVPDKSIDMILCDLPYGTTQCKWDTVIPFEPLWSQYKRIIKDNGAIVLTASQPFSSALVMSNITMFKYEWVWIKSKITNVLNAKKMPVRKHEQILVFSTNGLPRYYPQGMTECNEIVKQGNNSDNYGERNKREYVKTHSGCPRDVLAFASEGATIHPTQKPVALFEYLIKTYTKTGSTVLDNCAGSGTTGIACMNTGRNFILMEKDPDYFRAAKDRLREHDIIGEI